MARLLLIRHGESTWNEDGRWQGHADPPLSALGERQAHAAGRALGAMVAVWSSDLVRARQTAELIIAPDSATDVTVDPRLRERDVGEWTGLTRAQIEVEWPGYLDAYRSPPGFEPNDSLLSRVLGAVRDAAERAPAGDTLIVTHSGVIRTLERDLGARGEPLANLAGRWITADGDNVQLGARELLIDPDDVTVTVPRSL
jgi:broad specificity phosphatase PhoE